MTQNNCDNKIKFYGTKPNLFVSKKIAIVGNSDILLNKQYGSIIDSYDDVIRFNFGDLKKDITGLKTTIRWVNCPIDIYSAKEHNKNVTEHGLNDYCIKLFGNTKIICWDNLKKQLGKISGDFKFFTPNEMCVFGNINSYLKQLGIETLFDVIPNCWPRTGFQAVLTCIRSGCVPHLYGFDTIKKNKIKHYSDNAEYLVDKIKQHQIDTEIMVLQEMERKGLIIINK